MDEGAVTVDRAEQRRCTPNITYLRSLLGIIKIVQVVLSLLTFILSVSAGWGYLGGGWVNFVSINGFIIATIWLVLHMFDAVPQILANFLIEVINYALWTVFYFIAGVVAASRGYVDGLIGAASFFSFVCMIVFGIDSVFQFLDVRRTYKARNDRRGTAATPGAGANTEDTLFHRTDKEFY